MSAANGTNNEGHGHVYPRPDGQRARCGGPGFCHECSDDMARKHMSYLAAGDATAIEFRSPGLTKRELFAAMAMQGLLANSEGGPLYCEDGSIADTVTKFRHLMARLSLRYADALLAELDRK